MAMLTTKARAAAALDAVLATINDGAGSNGKLKIYTGSPPADVATGATGTLLSTCALVSGTQAAFGATNTTTLTATGYTSSSIFAQDTNTTATGTASYFRITNNGGTAVAQGSIGATGSGADLELSTTSIVSGATITISSFNVSISGIT